MKTCYLIQSYDELPFLLFLISRDQNKGIPMVINCGNLDLQKQLIQYQQVFNFIITKNILEKKEKYTTFFQYCLHAARFILKIHYLKYRLSRHIKIIFFTPFFVPLISIFGESKIEQLHYIPLPLLMKRKIITPDGLYNAASNSGKLGIKSIIVRFILGKHIKYHHIGSTRIPALSLEFLSKVLHRQEQVVISKDLYDVFLNETYPCLTEQNTVEKDRIHVIYFEQHYLERGLVFRPEYIHLIKAVIKYCADSEIPFYVKAHPGRKLEDFYNTLPHRALEASIPAELIVNNNTICLSTSSGAIAHKFGAARISLVNMMPFKQDKFRKNALLALHAKASSTIQFPIDDLELIAHIAKLTRTQI